MDKILIKDLKLYAFHGVNPEEKVQGQHFLLDIEAGIDLSNAPGTYVSLLPENPEKVAKEIKEVGGLIQVNADAITGKYKRKYGKIVKALLQEKLVDFVASDVHGTRKVVTAKARKKVEKKYGLEYAEEIFNSNAENIIKA